MMNEKMLYLSTSKWLNEWKMDWYSGFQLLVHSLEIPVVSNITEIDFVSIFYSIYSNFQCIQHQARIDFKRVTNSVECMYFENEQKSPNSDVWWIMRYQCMVCEKWCEGKGITNNVLGCIQLWMVMQY